MCFLIFVATDFTDRLHHMMAYGFYMHFLLPLEDKEALRDTIVKLRSYSLVKREDTQVSLFENNTAINLPVADIIWVDLVGRVTTIHMTHGRTLEYPHIEYPIKRMGRLLGPEFIQILRSCIVNKSYVSEVNFFENYLRLDGVDEVFRISHTYLPDVKECFGTPNSNRGE